MKNREKKKENFENSSTMKLLQSVGIAFIAIILLKNASSLSDSHIIVIKLLHECTRFCNSVTAPEGKII